MTRRFGYRPDIDGLRAIAVLLVLAFHAFPARVPGGFVGVDVFFVVSGYLITGIVMAAEASQAFSFRGFYANRVRRLVPALVTVLGVVLLAGALLLRPDEFARLGEHTAAGAAFVSNLLLWREGGYFNGGPLLRPLLHLWSLGVEEQFYLLWPALIVFAIRRRAARATVVMVCIASFALSLATLHIDYVGAFYLPFSRLWEMALGAVVVAWPAPGEPAAKVNRWGLWLVPAGLVAIAAAALTFNETSSFPGWRALVPAVGTMAILASDPRPGASRVLAWRPLVYLGLVSYPLYLWHWPALSLAALVRNGIPPAWPVRAALLLGSTVLAIATFELVEKPIRRHRRGPGVASLVALLGIAAAAGIVVWQREGFPARVETAPSFEANRHAVRDGPFEAPGTIDCRNRYDRSPGAFCRGVEAPAVAILGDSHAMRLFVGFAASGDPVFSRVMAIGREACAPGGDDDRYGCAEAIDRAVGVIEATPSVSAVVMTGSADSQAIGTTLARIVRRLLVSGRRVYYVADVPLLPFDPDTCLAARPFQALSPAAAACAFPRPLFDTTRTGYNQRLDELGRTIGGLRIFNPVPLFCDSSVCRAIIDGRLQYRDRDHLSAYGAARVATAFLKWVN